MRRALLSAAHFYPRSPCGERLSVVPTVVEPIAFLSTFPLRGTSECPKLAVMQRLISIHVPLAGNVALPCSAKPARLSFLSTFPLRGTSYQGEPEFDEILFLSTFPLRGTSSNREDTFPTIAISIHVPLAGNVASHTIRCDTLSNFYPRSPCGERHQQFFSNQSAIIISIHVPLAGNVK